MTRRPAKGRPRWVGFAALLALAGLAGVARLVGAASPPERLKPGASLDEVLRQNNHGAALMEQYKPAQAVEAFTQVTDLAPGWPSGFVNLGLAAFYARQIDRARAALLEAVRQAPESAQAHYVLATIYKSDGKSPEALAEFEKARGLDPEDADILYNVGLLHARQRQFGEAVAALSRARQIDPNSMSIRYQLARALLQAGDGAKGQAEMAAYQKLAANPKFAQPTGNQYGEAGRYALVSVDYRDLGGPPPPAEEIRVRFSDATAAARIAFVHAGPGGDAGAPPSPSAAGAKGAAGARAIAEAEARYGSGVGVGDLDGDGRPDLVFVNASADGTARLAIERNLGDFAFEDVTAAWGAQVTGIGLAAALGDYDNDGDLDLYVTRAGGGVLLQNQGGGKLKDVTAAAHAEVDGFATGAAWGDIDHDGDLDLLITRLPVPGTRGPAAAALLLNKGDGTFQESAGALKVQGPASGAIGALFSDLDLDRDVDVVFSAAGGPDALLDNRREEGFVDVGAAQGLASKGAGRGVAAGDVDGDGRPDLVFSGGVERPPSLYLNGPQRRFTARDLPRPHGGASYGAALFDADNDGDLDLVVTGSANLLLINDGHGQFVDRTADSGLGEIPFKDGRGVAAADLDGDGDLDLVVTRNGGAPLLLRNEGGSRNHWIDVQPRGLTSNRQGLGAKIEIQSGALWERHEATCASGYLSSSATAAHFGLGGRTMADVVRILWPGGVLQAEMDAPAGGRLEPQELDRKGSSCPLLFAWNGKGYGFVTDVLGVGGLGLWVAPGRYVDPVPDEYVRLAPEQLLPRDGAYDLQVLENLEEVTYLDAARLEVVDAPRDVDVYPNEDFGGPAAAHALYAVERKTRIAPTHAQDDRGRDVLDRVLAADRTYPDAFRLHSLAGYAEMHHLDLEFPESVEGKEGLVLFLYGWTDFEYSSSNYAAHQSGLTQVPPDLEMPDAEGQFRPVIDSIGFPPGLPRMIAVDLASLGPLPSRRMRLRSNMRVFWDQIFLARPMDAARFADKVQVHEVAPSGAHLHKRGFPREHSPDGREPRLYDYGILDSTQPFRTMTGDYTRFGRVTDLLADADDRAVIFGKGEEATLEFPVKGLPALASGAARSFVLHLSGWCKDMDPHTAHGETVEPLPFRAMTAYPYADGEFYPDDRALQEYRRTWNTRHLDGR